ncbi:hypothetical protein [Shewanella algae]|uniref:hypothetical protein n=1 Tax=Shewanella algae TaxID=38313 RepID=UPI0031F4E95E
MAVAAISDKLLGVILPMKVLAEEASSNAKRLRSKSKMNKGLQMITKGLRITCEGVNEILEETINEIMVKQKPNCSEEELAQVSSVTQQFDPFLDLIVGQDDSLIQEDVIEQICKLKERLTIYINIERQLHENLAIPASINIEAINKAVKNNTKGIEETWVEA